MANSVVFTIEDTRTRAVETQHVPKRQGLGAREQGIVIGFAEDCDVRVSGPGITAHHARWYIGGRPLRVDFQPFTLGPYVFSIGFD
ncbi:hypothetical protein [Myxococcus stipitatus]|uniref:hypothetical protein n=1 Tax=Myxococcus stipitatus TaxID=83455 RepID=UPI0030CFDDE7